MDRSSSPVSHGPLVPYASYDRYVSEVIGCEISTGHCSLDFESLSEEFRSQVAIDLEEQRERFAREDRELAAYIATLEASKGSKSPAIGSNGVVNEDEDDESDFDESLLDLDPVDYRKHDLYKVLGVEKQRWLATPEEMKAAYRRRVVKHHPDKLKQNPRNRTKIGNPDLEDDSFFKLIQKAWQVLTDPGRRADYDSCDPTFDENIPEDREYATEEEFIAHFAPVFARNARFSKKQPVPSMGDSNTPRSEVEAFYSFWINVESWRRFEWMDEDEPAGTDNRADKRWHEKKNKAKRDTRKKEDNSRLIRLVETAMKRDPRMIRWKDADRAAKAAKKNSKVDAVKAAKEAEAARKASEAAEKAAREATEKAAKDSAAAVKATAKAALKAGRKAFRDALGSVELWAVDLVAEIKTVQALGLAVERVLTTIGDDTDRLARVTESINSIIANFEGQRKGHLAVLAEFLQSVESNAEVSIEKAPVAVPVPVAPAAPVAPVTWEIEEIDILINAVKQYPGGSTNRWEQITTAVNRQISHSTPGKSFTIEQIIAQTNQVQSSKDNLGNIEDHRDEAQTLAALNSSKKKRDPRVDMAAPTIAAHYFDVEITEKENTSTPAGSISTTWTPEDQLSLESALKGVPAEDPLRWEKVAELVPGKSKKECLLRVKEIAAMIKSKK